MRTLGICGSGASTLVDRLVTRLDGVAVVESTGSRGADSRADGGVVAERPRTTYELASEGWTARGDGLDLPAVLDRLAPDHEYALVVGFPDADVPQVALGGVECARAELRADGPEDVDTEAVEELLAGLEPRETLESLVAEVKRSPRADRAGAIATFTGRVRARDAEDDDHTEYLEFEKYEGVADRKMREIESELEARDGVLDVVMYHRTGVIRDGEDIVFVVVLAGHREEAFRTVEDGINRLKDEVPLFKKEVTTEETFWVHERD
jgi:molybdopterin synthase catalytic subunit